MRTAKWKYGLRLLLFVVFIVLINLISSTYFYRFDLTTEKRFTLTPQTKELLKTLKKDLAAEIYLSGDLPPGFEKLKKSTLEILRDFDRFSKIKINAKIKKVELQNNDEIETLYKRGLQPTNLTVKNPEGKLSKQIIFPGLILHDREKEIAINLLKNSTTLTAEENLNNSIEMLEYELINAIRLLYLEEKKKIGFVGEHAALTELQTADIRSELLKYYQVENIFLPESSYLNDYNVIIIPKPRTDFSEEEKFLLDQFVMNGGKIIWLLDEVKVAKEVLTQSQSTIAFYQPLNLEDLLFQYGIRINPNLIMDAQCAYIPVKTSLPGEPLNFTPAPWYYEPLLMPNPQHTITKNLNLVRAEFANSIDFVGNDTSLTRTVLLSSSKQTRLTKVPAPIDLSIVEKSLEELNFNAGYQPVAVLLEGKFTSVFNSRSKFTKRTGFIAKSTPTQMIVVSDGDIIKNKIRGVGENTQILELGYDEYTGQVFGNKTFIINAVEYLCDKKGWTNLRNREITIRLLNKRKIQNQRKLWQIVNVVLPVLLVLIFAFLFQLWRKWKYAR